MAMTKDDIIRMAMESGITRVMDESSYRWMLEGREPINEVFIKFANLVATAEREACAKVLDAMAEKDKLSNYYRVAAQAIRAKGR